MAFEKSRRGLLVSAGLVIVLIGVVAGGVSDWPAWLTITGTLLAFAGLIFRDRSTAGMVPKFVENVAADTPETLEETRRQFEEWQHLQLADFERRDEELNNRQRDLLVRFSRYQEFLEYPIDDPDRPFEDAGTTRLSEKDHEVHALLEVEAERVYEKIRSNGYTKAGKVDLDTIWEETHSLVLRVAQIYSPDSSNPLLETSFEQLARSASRICLHSLVLLERLPLDVKRYNINEMYGYLRKAIEGYGTYQQVVPWIKHLSRGAYVGRIAAGTNPVSLGAWWLATEVGRRGAQKLVENVVDKQAVAVLHDIVTVIGVEVANVYGPGFRQRDAAWVYGAELTELLHRFPISRASLTAGLKEITVLPLRSEYDRVYLYRCLADHRAAGFRIHDSTLLGRSERDEIARKLEHFFTTHIHGTTADQVTDWQQDVESRLDLKLSFGVQTSSVVTDDEVAAAVTSIHSFLTSIVCTSTDSAAVAIEQTDLLTELPLEKRAPLLASLAASETRFAPPDLDPSAKLTDAFLNGLVETVVLQNFWEPQVEELVLETICYFRRSREEAVALFGAACLNRVRQLSIDGVRAKTLTAEQLRAVLHELTDDLRLQAVFTDVSIQNGGRLTSVSGGALVAIGADNAAAATKLLLLLSGDGVISPLWRCESGWSAQRRKGILIDDCEISGGEWLRSGDNAADGIVLGGSITGGGFAKSFGRLLATQE